MSAQSEAGTRLINEYAANIMTASAAGEDEPFPDVAGVSYRDFERQEFTLTDESVELIRSAVLKRCAVSADVDKNKLPWYFHYEFGVDLMEAGDAQRALDAFVLGANVRESSKRGKRMYGMWFVDYLPYYQIALAHAKLGNWEHAQDAIRVSEQFGEFSLADPDYDSFVTLDQLINSRLEETDS